MKSDGSIYFSDPWYGRMPVYGVERPRQLGFQGVYRVPPGGGAPELMVDRHMFDQPNGLCFSPDEHRLYVNDTVQALIRVFDVSTYGSLMNGRVFASGIVSEREPGVPDGMKCDSRGNVWVHGAGRRVGLCAIGRADRQGAGARDGRQPRLGRARFPARSTCAPRTRSIRSRPRSGRGSSPTCARARRGAPARSRELRGAAAPPPSPAPASPPPQQQPRRRRSRSLGRLDPSRCALIIQDMQNDVVMDGGAFASSGSPAHCKQQNAIANAMRLAEACRRRGVMVIHVWFIVEPGAPGVTLNAPLFEGLVEAKAMVRGTWGAAPVAGLEAKPGDHVVEKMRMSAWEGSSLETVLKSGRRDIVIVTGAWTNMSIEHTARTGADKGYVMIVPEDCCSTMNADWHRASINYALQNVSAVTKADDVIAALG